MEVVKKIGIGTAVAIGSAVAMGIGANATDKYRHKWFSNGYIAGFIDGAKIGLSIAEGAAKLANKIDADNSVILGKYNKLCKDYEELEQNYNEILNYYEGE